MSIICQYADLMGIDRKVVLDWVNSYINSPDQFPRLTELGLLEATKEDRSASIKEYLLREVESLRFGQGIAERIRNSLKEAA